MRWIWIDRILTLEQGSRCVAVKNVSLAEDVLHDHFPAGVGRGAAPTLPASLIIEGMAQTAGILVGHARDFREKVILAKIGGATFTDLARPGDQLRYEARIERIDASGASTRGVVSVVRPHADEGPSQPTPLAEIDLIFSHIDQNRSGLAFPERNFVFTDQFMDLLARSGFGGQA